MTDKDAFFTTLHADLGRRYNLTPSQVRLLRTLVLGQTMQQDEVIEWLKQQLKYTRYSSHRHNAVVAHRTHSRAFYERLLQFLTHVPFDVWHDVIHKTYVEEHV